MRTGHSSHRGSGSGVLLPAPGPEALARLQATPGELLQFCQAEAAFETLFACSPLTHHLALTLQAKGVNATVAPCASGHSPGMIHVPAGEKAAAIDIMLRILRDTRLPPGASAQPTTQLAA